MSLNKKYSAKDNKSPLIEEIVIDNTDSEDPNFILGDRRRELAMEEIILFLRKIKAMIGEKKIEVHITCKPEWCIGIELEIII